VTDVIFPPVPRLAYGVGVGSLERRRSVVDRLDDALLVVVALVGVVVLFSVVGWVVNTVVFFVKVALVAVFIGLIVRLVARRR
jgi:energy-coupling factor transporter transmembrane protein EcfT